MGKDDRQATIMPAASPRTADGERISRLTAIAEGLGAGGPDGWAGVQSILRELEALEPGCCMRMASALQLRSVRRAYANEVDGPS